MKCFIKISFSKTKEFKVQICTTISPFTNWICFSYQVTFVTITKDHSIHTKFLLPPDSYRFNATVRAYSRGFFYFNTISISGRLTTCDRKIKSFKKFSEFRVYAFRILYEILV